MTQAPASSVGKRVGLDSFGPSVWRATEPALAPTLSKRRRAENRKNVGFVAELRCECAISGCRETFPAAADIHRGRADHFIVAPAHHNGGAPVKVADRFFVISTERQ